MGGSGSRQQETSQDSSSDGSTTPSTSTITRKVEKSNSRLKFSFKRKPANRSRTGPFRELIKSWPISDLNLLLTEFEADAHLLKLQNECDLSRKSVNSNFDDFQSGSVNFGDLHVIFKTLHIKIHRHYLAQRCKNLQIPPESLDNFTLPANFQQFHEEDINAFLSEYIYTQKWSRDVKMLNKLRNEFGCHKKLQDDMIQAFRSDLKRGDLVITVINDHDDCDNEKDAKKEKKPAEKFEIRCSSTIAASRSRLIRSLLSRKNGTNLEENQKEISFSEEIFPRAFATLFINFLYTDSIDWSLAPSSEFFVSSLSQAKAITLGKNPDVQLCRAMQILQVARFFGVEGMVQACEDVIVRNLSPDNVISVLQWSEENSSKFIGIHALRLLEKEFHKISATSSFLEVSKHGILNLVDSHFIQTTELDLLDACVRWGEHALLKKLEEREPNVVADTCHSISRRGLKKTELSGEELKEILQPLTEKIRKDYVIPPFHQNLTDAYSRGILERSPLDLVVCEKTSEINPDFHWLKPTSSGPRYYFPYHKELIKYKNLLASTSTSSSSSSSGTLSGFQKLRNHLESIGISSSGRKNNLKLENDRLKPTEPSPSCEPQATESENFHVEFRNFYPEILDEQLFLAAKRRILELTVKWNVAELSRAFHKNLALEMITRRALLELDISPECFDCHVTGEKSTPPDVLPPPISGIYDIF
uniref:BACK domain-containing protein n=1 Tax=Caenorhabditis japonica TaxID=281687 RepID=A0A8R1HV88_CAEJA